MLVCMKQRIDAAADWTSEDPTLSEGQIGFESDTGKMKVGDGATAWTALAYFDPTPPGTIMQFGGSAAPSGYLLCDGAAVSRTTYARLFAVIGTAYGVGNGSTTFNVPDGQGRVFIGLKSADADFDALGETGGAKTVASAGTNTEASTHTHSGNTLQVDAHKLSNYGDSVEGDTGVVYDPETHAISGDTAEAGDHNHTFSGSLTSVVQPYIVGNWIIKT